MNAAVHFIGHYHNSDSSLYIWLWSQWAPCQWPTHDSDSRHIRRFYNQRGNTTTKWLTTFYNLVQVAFLFWFECPRFKRFLILGRDSQRFRRFLWLFDSSTHRTHDDVQQDRPNRDRRGRCRSDQPHRDLIYEATTILTIDILVREGGSWSWEKTMIALSMRRFQSEHNWASDDSSVKHLNNCIWSQHSVQFKCK